MISSRRAETAGMNPCREEITSGSGSGGAKNGRRGIYADAIARNAEESQVSGERRPAHHRHIDEIVARSGGPTLLSRIHDQLTEFLRGRPGCAVVYTDGRDPEQTYDAVTVVLANLDQARESSRATTALRESVGLGTCRVDELTADDLR
ncbi:hypothetical protein ACQPWY_01280 [Pseudonocardia xinjiangensis]|uniref:hypothetical protein n=1 Tax=Pseudonocardia xinjiangensis TaxID=75289 RepID=UPI003D8C1984